MTVCYITYYPCAYYLSLLLVATDKDGIETLPMSLNIIANFSVMNLSSLVGSLTKTTCNLRVLISLNILSFFFFCLIKITFMIRTRYCRVEAKKRTILQSEMKCIVYGILFLLSYHAIELLSN